MRGQGLGYNARSTVKATGPGDGRRGQPLYGDPIVLNRNLYIILAAGAALAIAGCGEKQEQTPEVAMEPAPLLDRELFGDFNRDV